MPEDPFRVLLRRDGPVEPTLTVRFAVTEGMGQLTLPSANGDGRGAIRPDALAVFGEEYGVDPEVLRGARFVYILNQERQSFSLSRVTADICAQLRPDAWLELRPLVDHGFRYLVAPDELTGFPATPAPAPARVALPPAPPVDPTPVAADTVDPLDELTREAAIRHLRHQLRLVESLQQRLEATEKRLLASRGRERDLLDMLAKWQDTD